MVKGKVVKDEDDLTKFGLKDGMTIMMMGTAEEKGLKEPEKPIKFLEDMTPEERAAAMHEKAAIVLPAGLENLGNTCYMNSTVQCLSRVKELKNALKTMQPPALDQMGGGGLDQQTALTLAGGQLMKDLEVKGFSYPPAQFVQRLRAAYPVFNETDDKGHHKQQDADECYQSIVQAFRAPLKKANDDEDLIGNLFEIEMQTESKCEEAPDEPPSTMKESVFKLSCHIDNDNNPVDQLWEGLKISLGGQVEKYSPTLDRDALYKKTSRINKLPQYLYVNFVRFYWKQESASAGTAATKAKILRNVAFPRILDVFEFCTPELQGSLNHGRELETKIRAEEDAKALGAREEEDKKKGEEMKGEEKKGGDVQMKDEEEKKGEEKPKAVGALAKAALEKQRIKEHDEQLYRDHGVGLDTGSYELIGVVTHKGRSADGGHYIGWIHASGDDWLQCDDDIITTVKTDDILALRGGGDWHTAYMCFYRKLEVVDKPPE